MYLGSSFTYAEVLEYFGQNVFDIDAAGQATQGLSCHPEFLGNDFFTKLNGLGRATQGISSILKE